MKNGIIRLGMAGAGKMALWHLKAYSRLSRVKVAAICNPDTDRGALLSRRFRIPRRYRSYSEMLAKETLDAVDLCIPTGLHAGYILQALDKGLHVYTEKPMCRTEAEAVEIIRANRRAGKIVFNGYNLRTWGPVSRLTAVIRSGRLGEIRFARFIRTTYEFPGSFMEKPELNSGVINEFSGHFIDLLQSWDLGRPSSVSAAGSCLLGPYGDPDTVSLYFHYAGGASALIHNSLGIPGITPEIVAVGRRAAAALIEGKVFIEPVPSAPDIFRSVLREFRHALVPPWRILNNPFAGSTRLFARAILEGTPNSQDEYSARQTIRLAALAQQSYREGRKLPVPEFSEGEGT